MPAPVDETCPMIDDVISDIKSASSTLEGLLNDFEEITPYDLKRELKQVISDLTDLGSKHSLIEEIRRANFTLRQWGNDLEDKADNLESERDDIKSETSEIIAQLREELSDLKEELKEAR